MEKLIHQQFERLEKTVKVSDPEHWYGKRKIKIALYVCPEWKGRIDVRLMAESIDDFAMFQDHSCFVAGDDEYHTYHGVKYVYDFLKENMFDTLPKTVSYKWLAEHGYMPY